mmetsp:Transcript_11172/g.41781  ORF Transcript_11172/g.41781 Transcript_11172/m.41781 type:complete len:86 (+) Transcript_11172:5829-6086(+)
MHITLQCRYPSSSTSFFGVATYSEVCAFHIHPISFSPNSCVHLFICAIGAMFDELHLHLTTTHFQRNIRNTHKVQLLRKIPWIHP